MALALAFLSSSPSISMNQLFRKCGYGPKVAWYIFFALSSYCIVITNHPSQYISLLPHLISFLTIFPSDLEIQQLPFFTIMPVFLLPPRRQPTKVCRSHDSERL